MPDINKDVGFEGGLARGLTALHAAALFGRLRVLLVLIHWGANVHVVDQYGRTALHMAVGLPMPQKPIYDI